MKNYIILLLTVIFSTALYAQAPNKINYQAVVRDADGKVYADREVRIEIQLIRDFDDGPIDYIEEHIVTTNQFGLINIQIGNGIPMVGNMLNIEWGERPYYVHVAVDPDGGTNFINLGVSELLTVPYAMHARTATNVAGGGDDQFLVLNGAILSIENGNSVDLSGLSGGGGGDPDSTNELQLLSLNNTALSISQGNTVDLSGLVVTGGDADSTNELQVLSISGDQLSISDGNTVTIPSGTSVWQQDQDTISYDGESTRLRNVNGDERVVFEHGNRGRSVHFNADYTLGAVVAPNLLSVSAETYDHAIMGVFENRGFLSLYENGDIRADIFRDNDGGTFNLFNNAGDAFINIEANASGSGRLELNNNLGNILTRLSNYHFRRWVY